MSLMERIAAAMVKPGRVGPIKAASVKFAGQSRLEAAPPPTPPPPPPTGTFRGSCKAINPATGRQCALLAGHTKPHRHGTTEFRFGAEPGQRFARRAELDAIADGRSSSPFTTPAGG